MPTDPSDVTNSVSSSKRPDQGSPPVSDHMPVAHTPAMPLTKGSMEPGTVHPIKWWTSPAPSGAVAGVGRWGSRAVHQRRRGVVCISRSTRPAIVPGCPCATPFRPDLHVFSPSADSFGRRRHVTRSRHGVGQCLLRTCAAASQSAPRPRALGIAARICAAASCGSWPRSAAYASATDGVRCCAATQCTFLRRAVWR